jgi:hypothetical protein
MLMIAKALWGTDHPSSTTCLTPRSKILLEKPTINMITAISGTHMLVNCPLSNIWNYSMSTKIVTRNKPIPLFKDYTLRTEINTSRWRAVLEIIGRNHDAR